jgi:hypothetical protein
MEKLVKETLEKVREMDPAKQENFFNQVKEKMMKDYSNFYLGQTYM